MMAERRPANIGGSVRARLLNLSRERGVEFQLLLSEFAIERLLFRLGTSAHASRFVLKGATLFRLWSPDLQRATWDVDLLSRSTIGVGEMVAMVSELCALPGGDDGIVFDTGSLKSEPIAEDGRYAGVRIHLEARLAEARIPVQLDIGIGDVVSPAPETVRYPTVLDHAPPEILVYPREVVVAEKLEAIVSLGITNSRMKDFYDLRQLAALSTFDGIVLAESIRATFARRSTPLPTTDLIVLQPGFLSAPERQAQWRAFLRRSRLPGLEDAASVQADLRRFLMPLIAAVAMGERFAAHWAPGGPWRRTDDTAP